MKTITCIIPAYNEEKRIRHVLNEVIGQDYISEIIVVNDGSTDNTKFLLESQSGIKVIQHHKNLGKTAAMISGIKEAKGDFLLFLDSDLVGITSKDIQALLAPVETGVCDISISLRSNSPFLWKWIGLDYISGERMVPKDLFLGHLKALESLRPFAFEVFINSIIIRRKLRLAVVRWDNVISPIKSRKHGLWQGIKGDIRMMGDIFSVVSPLGVLNQIFQMLRLKVN